MARDVARVVDDRVPLAARERLEVAVAIAVQLLEVGEAAGVGLAAVEQRHACGRARARRRRARGPRKPVPPRIRIFFGLGAAAARRGRRVMAAAAASDALEEAAARGHAVETPRARVKVHRLPFVDDAAGRRWWRRARACSEVGGAAIEDGEIGGHARRGAAAPGLLEGGEGGAGGERAQRLVEREPLIERPAGALDGGAKAGDDARLLDGEVAAEGEARAGVEHAAPGVGARDALGADARLGPRHVAGGVRRLHRGDDAELGEARDVVERDHLRVLDAEALRRR